jgi:hypothetical protein
MRVVLARAGELREQLNWYSRTILLMEGRSGRGRNSRLVDLRRAAQDCEQRLVEALSTLEEADPEFSNLQGAGSIGLEEIRASLPAGAMLVQFYRVRDAFHACLLSAKKLVFVPLGSAIEVRRGLQLLRFQLSKFRLGHEYAGRFHGQLLQAANAHLQEFYRLLIAPMERELDAEHLIIAPHDLLHYLPFHALLDGDCPLGDRFSISYAPSGSVFALCGSKPAAATGRPLVMGVPDEEAPHILDEVRAIASVLPDPEVLIGADATREALREKGPLSRLIHIATHASFRQDNPMFSSISLGDSQLNLFDLYQLRLPAELVTLSGCGTGLNMVVGGDELRKRQRRESPPLEETLGLPDARVGRERQPAEARDDPVAVAAAEIEPERVGDKGRDDREECQMR